MVILHQRGEQVLIHVGRSFILFTGYCEVNLHILEEKFTDIQITLRRHFFSAKYSAISGNFFMYFKTSIYIERFYAANFTADRRLYNACGRVLYLRQQVFLLNSGHIFRGSISQAGRKSKPFFLYVSCFTGGKNVEAGIKYFYGMRNPWNSQIQKFLQSMVVYQTLLKFSVPEGETAYNFLVFICNMVERSGVKVYSGSIYSRCFSRFRAGTEKNSGFGSSSDSLKQFFFTQINAVR